MSPARSGPPNSGECRRLRARACSTSPSRRAWTSSKCWCARVGAHPLPLTQSEHADGFLLKGALLFTLGTTCRTGHPRRRLLGFGKSDLASIADTFREVAAVAVTTHHVRPDLGHGRGNPQGSWLRRRPGDHYRRTGQGRCRRKSTSVRRCRHTGPVDSVSGAIGRSARSPVTDLPEVHRHRGKSSMPSPCWA